MGLYYKSNFILEIEKKFKVKFGADNYEDLDSIKKIINLVKKKTI